MTFMMMVTKKTGAEGQISSSSVKMKRRNDDDKINKKEKKEKAKDVIGTYALIFFKQKANPNACYGHMTC